MSSVERRGRIRKGTRLLQLGGGSRPEVLLTTSFKIVYRAFVQRRRCSSRRIVVQLRSMTQSNERKSGRVSVN